MKKKHRSGKELMKTKSCRLMKKEDQKLTAAGLNFTYRSAVMLLELSRGNRWLQDPAQKQYAEVKTQPMENSRHGGSALPYELFSLC